MSHAGAKRLHHLASHLVGEAGTDLFVPALELTEGQAAPVAVSTLRKGGENDVL
jgi:hypothetical protein